ncbi:MAG: NYN domain-containing protein [Verrucomicrobiota bacterium]
MDAERYLLIDSHNVICDSDRLRRILDGNHDAARDQLAKIALAIHDAEGVRVAMILDSKNDTLQVEHPFEWKTFEYLYAPVSLTADGVIERIIRRVQDTSKVTVVSNDNMVREATRSVGAIALRPEEFFEWASACERRLRQDAIRRNATNADAFENKIDIDLS